jgi:hypothetical protein
MNLPYREDLKIVASFRQTFGGEGGAVGGAGEKVGLDVNLMFLGEGFDLATQDGIAFLHPVVGNDNGELACGAGGAGVHKREGGPEGEDGSASNGSFLTHKHFLPLSCGLFAGDGQAIQRFDMGAADPERIDVKFVQAIAQGQGGIADTGNGGGNDVEVGGLAAMDCATTTGDEVDLPAVFACGEIGKSGFRPGGPVSGADQRDGARLKHGG